MKSKSPKGLPYFILFLFLCKNLHGSSHSSKSLERSTPPPLPLSCLFAYFCIYFFKFSSLRGVLYGREGGGGGALTPSPLYLRRKITIFSLKSCMENGHTFSPLPSCPRGAILTDQCVFHSPKATPRQRGPDMFTSTSTANLRNTKGSLLPERGGQIDNFRSRPKKKKTCKRLFHKATQAVNCLELC